MKQLTVYVDKRLAETETVILNIPNASGDLTSSMAKQARRMVSPFANVTVTDGNTSYRVTKFSCRKVD